MYSTLVLQPGGKIGYKADGGVTKFGTTSATPQTQVELYQPDELSDMARGSGLIPNTSCPGRRQIGLRRQPPRYQVVCTRPVRH